MFAIAIVSVHTEDRLLLTMNACHFAVTQPVSNDVIEVSS